MTQETFYVCSDCGSSVLAVSHTWTEEAEYEEVGYVQDNGRYQFDKRVELDRKDNLHEWIAYCGGCGKGITVEWLPEDRVRLIVKEDKVR